MADDSSSDHEQSGSTVLTIVVCTLLVLATAGVGWWIYESQPEAQQSESTRETAMLVEVTTAERGTFRPQIVALGPVRPAREIQLSPRVAGEVIARSPAFNPGGVVEKGQLLLEIDPADFQNALQQRQSERDQAQADLQQEMGRQRIAASDLELLKELEESTTDNNRDLVLRKPQLDTARAQLASAEAALKQARLDLERTTIKAPFTLQVLERNVDVGSQVAPAADLGRLVGIETYWVIATVPLEALAWIEFSDEPGQDGSSVEIRNRAAWPPDTSRQGRVAGLVGTLSEETRLARILVTVDDPLALEPAHDGQPRLLLGSIVQGTITGREIKDVVRLDRSLLREGDTVWVMDEDDLLHLAEVEVTFRDARYAYVSSGLDDGDRVITTNLATVSEDAPLRLEGGGE